MRELPTAYPLRDLFDAAVRHRSIRLTCTRCGHTAVLSSVALWWHFDRRGWPDRFHQVPPRCVCTRCLGRDGLAIRNPRLDLVDEPPQDCRLPMPRDLDWKRELRRRR